MKVYRKGSIRWLIYKLDLRWSPVGVLGHITLPTRLKSWEKKMMREAIKESRELLDALEAKIEVVDES